VLDGLRGEDSIAELCRREGIHHESINNVTPADVYFGHDKALLKQREGIKRKTLEARRLHRRQHAA
jgi:hypothetical protein